MVHYKLIYFDAMGRGECVRLVFALANQSFEDVRFGMEDWPQLKNQMPFGSVPVLEVDGGEKIGETVAICRFVGETLHLTGSNPRENATINMWVDAANDLWTAMAPVIQAKLLRGDDEASAKAAKEMMAGAWKTFCDRFEAFLSKSAGGWLVGNKPTWGDAYIGDWFNRVTIMDKTALDHHPKCKDYTHRFFAIPSVAKHIAGRKQLPF